MSSVAKRKREAQDMGSVRGAPSMAHQNAFDHQYLHHTLGNDMEHGGTDPQLEFIMAHHPHPEDGGGHTHPPPPPAPVARGMERGAGQTASDTAAAAMAQYRTMTVPQPTEQTFMHQTGDASPGNTGARGNGYGDYEVPKGNGEAAQDEGPTGMSSKPAVGTQEWHKIRKDNHKEVERRRRETINEGINELAQIVPGCEKNKGSILQRAVQFIRQLKENETRHIEKWTLEKMLTEQAIGELSASCEKLKSECQRAWDECEHWKKLAQEAGVTIKTDD